MGSLALWHETTRGVNPSDGIFGGLDRALIAGAATAESRE